MKEGITCDRMYTYDKSEPKGGKRRSELIRIRIRTSNYDKGINPVMKEDLE